MKLNVIRKILQILFVKKGKKIQTSLNASKNIQIYM